MKYTAIAFVFTLVFITNSTAQMTNDNLFFTKKVQGTFEEVYEKVIKSIESNGFGVVTELSMDKKLKEKLDVEIGTYHMLGVCNPKLAHKAIQVEENIGVFLPCKLIIKKVSEAEFEVVTFNPTLMMGILNNEELNTIAAEVENHLKAILQGIE